MILANSTAASAYFWVLKNALPACPAPFGQNQEIFQLPHAVGPGVARELGRVRAQLLVARRHVPAPLPRLRRVVRDQVDVDVPPGQQLAVDPAEPTRSDEKLRDATRTGETRREATRSDETRREAASAAWRPRRPAASRAPPRGLQGP